VISTIGSEEPKINSFSDGVKIKSSHFIIDAFKGHLFKLIFNKHNLHYKGSLKAKHCTKVIQDFMHSNITVYVCFKSLKHALHLRLLL